MGTLTISDVEKIVDKKIKESNNKLSMFGKSFNTIGDLNANLVLKSKGDVKILQGGKFINLIKDGKVNCEGSDHLFIVTSEDEIKAEGVYIIPGETDNQLLVKIKDTVVSLDSGSSVSYKVELFQDAESRMRALKNIGFMFKDLNEAQEAGIAEGIVYILSEAKLYTIKDSIFTEYITSSKTFLESEILEDLKDQNEDLDLDVEEIKPLPTIWEFGNYIIEGDSLKLRGSSKNNGLMLAKESGETVLFIDKIYERHKEETVKPEFIANFIGLRYCQILKAYLRELDKEDNVSTNIILADLINPPVLKKGDKLGVNYPGGCPLVKLKLYNVNKFSDINNENSNTNDGLFKVLELEGNNLYYLTNKPFIDYKLDLITHMIYRFSSGKIFEEKDLTYNLTFSPRPPISFKGSGYYNYNQQELLANCLGEMSLTQVNVDNGIKVIDWIGYDNIIELEVLEVKGNTVKLSNKFDIFDKDRVSTLNKQYIYVNEANNINLLPKILPSNKECYLKSNTDGTSCTWVNAFDDVIEIFKKYIQSREGREFMTTYLLGLGFCKCESGLDDPSNPGDDPDDPNNPDNPDIPGGPGHGGQTDEYYTAYYAPIMDCTQISCEWIGFLYHRIGTDDILVKLEVFDFNLHNVDVEVPINLTNEPILYQDTRYIEYEGNQYEVTADITLFAISEEAKQYSYLDIGTLVIKIVVSVQEMESTSTFSFSGYDVEALYINISLGADYQILISKDNGLTYLEDLNNWDEFIIENSDYSQFTPNYEIDPNDKYTIVLKNEN